MMILLTRAHAQADSPLTKQLETHAIPWLNLACLSIDPPRDPNMTSQQLNHFNTADQVIITSANAANMGLRTSQFDRQRSLIAIGPATQRALQALGFMNVVIPTQDYSSEGLLALPTLMAVKHQSVLVVTGESPRPLLANTLESRGATVIQAFTYRRTQRHHSADKIRSITTQPITHIVTMSNETLDALCNLFSNQHDWLRSKTLYVSSKRQLNAALAHQFTSVVLIPSPFIDHLMQTLLSSHEDNR